MATKQGYNPAWFASHSTLAGQNNSAPKTFIYIYQYLELAGADLDGLIDWNICYSDPELIADSDKKIGLISPIAIYEVDADGILNMLVGWSGSHANITYEDVCGLTGFERLPF